MKLWWVHNEVLNMHTAYGVCRSPGDEKYWERFKTVPMITPSRHFSDSEYGEWYGYLHQ